MNSPQTWTILLLGGGGSSLAAGVGGGEYAILAAAIVGMGGALATAVSSFIVQVGKAKIQAERDRLEFEKERSEVFGGQLAKKFQEISDELDLQKVLNQSLQDSVQDLKSKLDSAKASLKEYHARTSEHEAQSESLRKEVEGLKGELDKTKSEFQKVAQENSRLTLIVASHPEKQD